MDLDLDRTDFENTGKWVRTDHWYDNQRIIGTIIFSYVKLILNEIHGKFSSSVRRARETEIRFFFPIQYDIIIRLEFIIVLGEKKPEKRKKKTEIQGTNANRIACNCRNYANSPLLVLSYLLVKLVNPRWRFSPYDRSELFIITFHEDRENSRPSQTMSLT